MIFMSGGPFQFYMRACKQILCVVGMSEVEKGEHGQPSGRSIGRSVFRYVPGVLCVLLFFGRSIGRHLPRRRKRSRNGRLPFVAHQKPKMDLAAPAGEVVGNPDWRPSGVRQKITDTVFTGVLLNFCVHRASSERIRVALRECCVAE